MNRSPGNCSGAWSQFAPALLTAVLIAIPEFTAQAESDSEALEELEAYAERYLTFLSDIEATYFDRAQKLNGRMNIETRKISFDFGDYEPKTIRGPVVEKMGRILTKGKKPVFSFQRPTEFSRHMVIDVHPKSPLVGSLHMTLMLQYEADGTSAIMGWFDILSGSNRQEDLALLRKTMDEVFASQDHDIEPYRKRLCAGDGMEIHRARRKSDCAGLSFQGMPMMAVNEENYQLVTQAFDGFLDAYFKIIERRKDDSFSEIEVIAQQDMRRDYFEYNLKSDIFFKSGYPPFEVWSLVVAPPTLTF